MGIVEHEPGSIKKVLRVIKEFEQLEPTGVSAQLIAWELLEPEHVVTSLMTAAEAEAMVEPAGFDDKRGERLWQLTARGQAALAEG
jgi:hypothetical protein